MLAYYRGAFSRSFWGAVDWAIGQGWLLSLLLAIGVVVPAVAYSVIRAWRGHQSWRDAMNDISGRLKDFVLAFIGGSVVVLFGLFAVFFVSDAPTQLAQYDKAITQNNIYKDEISGNNGLEKKLENATAQLKDLQRKYDILSALKSPNMTRDPNALYQLGRPVGRLIGAIIDLSHSQVLYQAMRYQGDYDPNSPSEFQDVKIQCIKNIGAAPPAMGNNFSGMVTGGSCSILGSVQ